MMERGGVLHRDVSSGNILIVEEPQERPSSKGILHDYDYSSMTPYPPDKACQGASSDSSLLRPLELADDCEDVGECKERAVSILHLVGLHSVSSNHPPVVGNISLYDGRASGSYRQGH